MRFSTISASTLLWAALAVACSGSNEQGGDVGPDARTDGGSVDFDASPDITEPDLAPDAPEPDLPEPDAPDPDIPEPDTDIDQPDVPVTPTRGMVTPVVTGGRAASDSFQLFFRISAPPTARPPTALPVNLPVPPPPTDGE